MVSNKGGFGTAGPRAGQVNAAFSVTSKVFGITPAAAGGSNRVPDIHLGECHALPAMLRVSELLTVAGRVLHVAHNSADRVSCPQ